MDEFDPVAMNIEAAKPCTAPWWNMLIQFLGGEPKLPAAKLSVMHPGIFSGRDLDDELIAGV